MTHFIEKPTGSRLESMAHASKHATPGDPFEASMGVYIFKRDVLVSLLQENEDHFGSDAGPDTHFGHDVIPHALREGYRVVAHHFDGYWRVWPHVALIRHPRPEPLQHHVLAGVLPLIMVIQQTSSVENLMQELAGLRDYYEANLELAMPKSPISIFDVDEAIVSRGHILPPSIIHGCTITNTLVGEGSVLVVRPTCRRLSLRTTTKSRATEVSPTDYGCKRHCQNAMLCRAPR